MNLFCRLIGLFFVSLFISCAAASPLTHFHFANYRSVPAYSNPETYKEIVMYVDESFSTEKAALIDESVNEWNYVLNGAAKFKVIHWDFNKDSLFGKRVIGFTGNTPERVIMLNLNSDDPIVINALVSIPEGNRKNVLAFVSKRGRDLNTNYLVVLKDKMDGSDYHKMLLHELGHVLNASHVNMVSVMYPYNGSVETGCIDKVTAAQVAFSLKVAVDHMNYCQAQEMYK